VGFVRWTEQRNFEAVLDMMADGRLNVRPLISHRFDITDAQQAYELVGGSTPSMGILLRYPERTVETLARTVALSETIIAETNTVRNISRPSISFIGSGNYATAVLIPAFKATGAHLRSVASASGVSGVHAGRKFGFAEATTDTAQLLSDPLSNAIVITTRHDTHAGYTVEALKAGKHVFVEKPLCLTIQALHTIESTYQASEGNGSSKPILMVGFNRRFAPQVKKIKQLLSSVSVPKSFVMTVNAGSIPQQHWAQDIEVGGGRLLGEACHFVDLLRFLADSPISGWHCTGMSALSTDTVTIQLSFVDGSIGTVHYFANGSKSFPKERLEVFAAGRVLQLDNFRKLTGYGWPGFKKMNLWRQDKGQHACAQAFIDAISSGNASPIPAEELFEISRVMIDIAQAQ
jgi:predicted dehydrogenase